MERADPEPCGTVRASSSLYRPPAPHEEEPRGVTAASPFVVRQTLNIPHGASTTAFWCAEAAGQSADEPNGR